MGDIIEKIIDSRYIGIFSSYRLIIVIECVHLEIIEKLLISKNAYPISSNKLQLKVLLQTLLKEPRAGVK